MKSSETYGICARCGRRVPLSALNTEAPIHHGRQIECLDRKGCERARRKARRRGR